MKALDVVAELQKTHFKAGCVPALLEWYQWKYQSVDILKMWTEKEDKEEDDFRLIISRSFKDEYIND